MVQEGTLSLMESDDATPTRLATLLTTRAAIDVALEFRPQIFHPDVPVERASLELLLASDASVIVCDRFREQVAELVELRQPSRTFSPAELQREVEDYLSGRPSEALGVWVYYPWSRRLVHLVSEGEFLELRTNRNRYKITPDEQARLRRATIGVVGLSVGLASAVTLAQEGIGGRFRLADFDIVGATNLNRLRCSVADLGTLKTVVAARQIFELDPFVEVELFSDGVSDDRVEQFLTDGGEIDLLVEECDDLEMKLVLREHARAQRIPVVMETSDGGMLDIERFDLEPARELFHGLVPGLDARRLRGLPIREKLPYILRILGIDRLSTRAAGSLLEVKETASTWPQLASAVALGGALVTDAARRILLDELRVSGRFYVELDELVRAGRQVEVRSTVALSMSTSEEALSPASLTRPSVESALHPDHVRALVKAATLAPSGGNTQPWHYEFRDDALHALLERGRINAGLDFDFAACYLAHGAAVENMVLHATTMGLGAQVEFVPERPGNDLVCRVRFVVEPTITADPLAGAIARRVTNRRLGARTPLLHEHRSALERAASERGARLIVLDDPSALSEAAEILAATDRLSFLNKVLHRAIMSEMRWDAAEVERSRDGLDATTLELSAADLAAFRVMSNWGAMQFVGRFGGGRALEQPARKAIAAASALCLLTRPGTSNESYFQGGRALQRVWLRATELGLAVQPMSALPYLFARMERGDPQEFLSDAERATLQQLRRRYLGLFPVEPDHAELLLFRIATASAPSARSLRRPVDVVLRIVSPSPRSAGHG